MVVILRFYWAYSGGRGGEFSFNNCENIGILKNKNAGQILEMFDSIKAIYINLIC